MCIPNSYQRRAPESSGLEVYVHICYMLQSVAVGTEDVQQLWQTNVNFLALFSKMSRKTFG